MATNETNRPDVPMPTFLKTNLNYLFINHLSE